ncbi:hypothetical protein BaRGS_00034957 [Batillaria attramentaria]|uniref:Uncharacterized protein n=1 Tax=Batillaria attramentaria TaxID=370345 RepID=A0ABD0JG93_9CAEN
MATRIYFTTSGNEREKKRSTFTSSRKSTRCPACWEEMALSPVSPDRKVMSWSQNASLERLCGPCLSKTGCWCSRPRQGPVKRLAEASSGLGIESQIKLILLPPTVAGSLRARGEK